MNRLVRDNKVAVLFHPDYGSGWYTNHYIEELLFDPAIVQWVEADEYDKVRTYVTLKYPKAYLRGLEGLEIEWLPIGTEFRIDEYDGAEVIKYKDNERWIKA